MNAILAGVPREADAAEGGVTQNAASAAQSTDLGLGRRRCDGLAGG